MTKNVLHTLLILTLSMMTFSPLSIFADDLVEGSALDSMEDLVSDLDEDLSDDDLANALAEENEQAVEQEAESEPAPEVKPEVKPEPDTSANTKVPAPEAKVVETAQATSKPANKPNALLILKSDQNAKVWINGRYRGRVSPKRVKRFPVRSGKVVVTAKSDRGTTRRLVKNMRPKSKVTATIRLGAKKSRKTRKATKTRKTVTSKVVKKVNKVRKSVKSKKNVKKRRK
jgi:hypothetical protein